MCFFHVRGLYDLVSSQVIFLVPWVCTASQSTSKLLQEDINENVRSTIPTPDPPTKIEKRWDVCSIRCDRIWTLNRLVNARTWISCYLMRRLENKILKSSIDHSTTRACAINPQ
jgi:hypothetical protein